MQRLQHDLGMELGDAEEGAGGGFSGLFPILQGSRTGAHEGGELGLAEAGLFAH
jgi:hypothetical protein